MKNFIRILFALFFIASGYQKADATHVMGSDITWEYMGKDTVKITVAIYRDCNGINLSATPISVFAGTCGTTSYTSSLSLAGDVTPVCDAQCTRCASNSCTFSFGIQKYLLTAIIDVSDPRKNGCCELRISWAQCCRNNAITTGAANQNFYLEAKLNICNGVENSPVFKNDPLALICLGRHFEFSQGAADPDNDSLVYSLTDPLINAAGGRTTWLGNYSSQKPLHFLGFPNAKLPYPRGFRLDPTTGDLSFRPMRVENTVMTIKVESFRNGTKISEVRRDIQVLVMKCPNNKTPIISGSDCSAPEDGEFTVYVCEGAKLDFKLCATDPDKKDSLWPSYNSDAPGLTVNFSQLASNEWESSILWKPTVNDIRDEPYFLNFYATDKICPVPGKANRTFKIYVKREIPVTLTADVSSLPDCDLIAFDAVMSNSSPVEKWEWFEDGNLVAKTKNGFHRTSPGKKRMEVWASRHGCVYKAFDSVEVDTAQIVVPTPISDIYLCSENEVIVDLKPQTGTGKFTYVLDYNGIIDSLPFGSSLATLTFKDTTDSIPVNYYISDGSCFWADEFAVITLEDRPKNVLGDIVDCDPNVSFALPLYLGVYGSWTGDGVNGKVFDGALVSNVSSKIQFEYSDRSYCYFDDATITLPGKNKAWDNDTIETCINHDSIPLPQVTGGYTWSGAGLVANEYFYKPGLAGVSSLKCVYDVGGFCRDSFLVLMNIQNRNISVDAGGEDTVCFEDSAQYCFFGSPLGGKWSGMGISNPNANCVMIDRSFLGRKGYSYRVVDRNHCVGTDVFNLAIGDYVKADFSANVTSGTNPLVVKFSDDSEGKVTSWNWSFGDPLSSTSSQSDPQFTYADTGNFTVTLRVNDSTALCESASVSNDYIVVTGINGFEENAFSRVTVFPNPASRWITLKNLPEEAVDLDIMSLEGKTIFSYQSSKENNMIDLGELSAGTYLIRLRLDDSTSTFKIQVTK